MYALYEPDGFRQLMTIKFAEGMSKEELQNWWFRRAEIVKKTPNLKWYTVCFTLDTINYSDGSPGYSLKFDGYEELYFNTFEELKNSYDSTEMQKSFADLKNNEKLNKSTINIVWAEANVIKMKGLISPPKQKGCYRVFGGCCCTTDMNREDLKKWYHSHAEKVIDSEGRMIIPEIIGYIHNFALDDSPFGKPFIDAYCNNWWASLEDMMKTFEGEIWKGQLVHREEHIDIVDKSLFSGAVAKEFIIDLN